MRWRIPLVAVLALFVAVSCDQQPVEPEPAETALFAGADVENEFIYVWPWRLTWMDADRDAGEDWDVLLLGYHPAGDASCNDGESVGGVLAKVHNVFKDFGDDGERHVNIAHLIGRPPLYMYEWAEAPFGGSDEDWCDYFVNDWFAKGSWTASSTDNDVSCFDGTPGVNSYGQTETGRLKDEDGNKYKYSWKYHQTCDSDRDPVFKTMRDIDMVERK